MASGLETPADRRGKAHQPPARRRRAFRVAAITGSLILAVLCAEAVLRVYVAARGWTPNCYAGSALLLVPEEVNGYELDRAFHLRSGIYEITTNAHGLRGPDRALEKPARTLRIAVLGGSSVFGYLVSNNQTASHLLEQSLNADGLDVEVLNAGVPGYNLFQSTHRYRTLISRFAPDIVVIYAGWNDLTYLTSEEPAAARIRRGQPYPCWQRLLSRSTLYGLVAFRLLSPPARFAPPARPQSEPTRAGTIQFEHNLADLITCIRESGAHPVVCLQVTAAHPDATDDVRRYLGAKPRQQEQNATLGRRLHRLSADLAAREGVMVIDAYNEIPATTDNLGDAIHLTASGEEHLAALWHRSLKPLLDELCVDPTLP
jgi:lysophospholipase L1-like esterase